MDTPITLDQKLTVGYGAFFPYPNIKLEGDFMTDVSDKPASEQLDALENSPEYKAFISELANDTAFMKEVHDVIPDFLYDVIGVAIKASQKVYGYVNVSAIEAGVASAFQTWLASDKMKLTNDPLGTIQEAIKEGIAFYNKLLPLIAQLGVVATSL